MCLQGFIVGHSLNLQLPPINLQRNSAIDLGSTILVRVVHPPVIFKPVAYGFRHRINDYYFSTEPRCLTKEIRYKQCQEPVLRTQSSANDHEILGLSSCC